MWVLWVFISQEASYVLSWHQFDEWCRGRRTTLKIHALFRGGVEGTDVWKAIVRLF